MFIKFTSIVVALLLTLSIAPVLVAAVKTGVEELLS